MSNHTPGPWAFDGDIVWATGVQAANICRMMGKRKPLAANAALVAAAPELLVTLQNCVNVLALALPLFDDESTDNKDSRDEVESVIDAARAAIAKAEGRGS